MPNFNYENPRNAEGGSMQSPKEQLFLMVLNTIAYEGWRTITLEGLREKGVDAALLADFDSVGELCEAALLDAADRVACTYESVTEEARAYLASGSRTQDESFKQLERLLYRHIYLCFHPKNRVYMLVAALESQLPEGAGSILPDALQAHFGKVLTDLIMAVSQVKNAQIAALSACLICGAVNAFVQQPQLCGNLFTGATREKPNYAVVEDFMNNYFLRAIAANTAINKPF